MINHQVKNLYLEGKTVSEIINITGFGKTTIRRWLRELNIYEPNRDKKLCDYTNLDFFHEINTEEKAYWLGFIQADGNIHSTNYTCSVVLSKKDENHLIKIGKIFNKSIKEQERICNLSKNLDQIYESINIVINSKELYNDLINHGIEENKSNVAITNILNFIPNHLINHFIRGIFDGDGSISHRKNKKRRAIFELLGIKDFLEKTEMIMKKEIPNLSNRSLDCDKRSNSSSLKYNKHNDLISIYNWLYKDSTVWLERKRDKFKEIIQELIPKDREKPPYKGMTKHNSKWEVKIRSKHIGNYSTELEAAYWHDLEQVKLLDKEAKCHMNFPSQYENFVEWIQQGY